MSNNRMKLVVKKSLFKKIISCLLSISLLVNSLLPYSIASVAYAQELTSPTPSATSSPEITLSASPEPTFTATPSATPEVIIESSPEVTPSATLEPIVETTPTATPTAEPTSSTESASLSEEKIPLRKAGNLLKEVKKQTNKNYVEGEVIVKFKTNKLNVKSAFGKAQAFVFEKKFSLNKKDEIKSANIQVFESKKSTEEMVKELKADSNVEYAEPNYIRPWSSTTPNDPNFSLQWALNNTTTPTADVSAPEAWETATGNDSIIVGILDSGVAYNHPDLLNNMWNGSSCKDENNSNASCPNHGWDFVNTDNNPIDDNGHGTHVAGIVGAEGNNSKGITGMNWNVKLMALKVGDYSGAIVGDVVKAIDFAINNNVKILNASFGGVGTNSQSEYDAINRFKTAGGIFVAAAGNGGADFVGDNNESAHFYPSDYDLDNIISVAATDQNDSLASFSNYGATSVDVGAPGTNIYSTGFLNEDFSNASLPGFTNTIFTKTSGGWKTGTWGNFGGNTNDKNAQANSSYINGDTSELILTVPMEEIVQGENVSLNFYLYANIESSTSCLNDYFSIETDNNDGNWVEKDYGCGYLEGNYSTNLGPATSEMRTRFVWHTNGSVTGTQVPVIDDIEFTNTLSYQYKDGTSMAAPHVAGLAALIRGYNPNLSYSQVKSIILDNGDSASALSGKTVSGKRINAKKALDASAPVLSTIATVTSATYTVGATTITNVPFGTSKATFETALTKGESHQTWTDSGVHDPVVTGDVLVVTAQDGSTQVTYIITVNPDYATIFGGITTALLSQGITTNINTCASTPTGCTGLYFEKTGYGRVTFNSSLNLTDTNTNTFLQTLGTKMDASNGSMSFDARTAEQLRTAGAVIKIYGFSHGAGTDPITVSELVIKNDSGVIIDPSDENYPSITGFTWDNVNGAVTFGTDHFTQFYLNDTIKPSIVSFSVPSTATSLEVSGITVTAHDNRGVAGLMFSESSTAPNITDPMWSSGTPSTYNFASAGTKTLYAWAKDDAGNVSNVYDGKQVTITLAPPPNNAPSFDSIASQSVNEDSSSQEIPITGVSAGSGEDSQTVTMTATSSNTNIIPNPTVTGVGATRTLTYAPIADAYGTVTISVLANDEQTSNNTYSQSFNITVNSVNDTPSFTKGSDQTILEDAGAQTVSGWATSISVGPSNESGQTLNFNVINSNSSLFSVQPTVAAMANGKLTYTPAANANGSATVTVSLSDNDGATSATQTFTITVNPVNDFPAITLISPNGGEVWAGGSNQTITWSASDVDIGQTLLINLDYTINGGATYTNIVENLTNSGTYTWSVPVIESSTVKIKALVMDDMGSLLLTNSDLSDANFTIDSTAPGITYNYPTVGGQTTWYNSDPGNVIDVDFIWGGGSPLDNAQRKIGAESFTNIFTADQSSNYTTNWGFPTWSSLSEGLNEISLKVADTVGNEKVESYVAGVSGFLFRKDTGAPTTTDSGIDANWHNNDVTVTLNCLDPVSSCATTYHTTDGTIPTTSSSTTNPFTLTTNGNYTIKYFSKDIAGNSETVRTAEVTVKIDKTKPVIAFHENITATATSEDGKVVTYTSPLATDNVDAPADAVCTLASGSTFVIGTTTVTCTKTDTAGNTATPTTFTVTVTANTAPSFDAIANPVINEDSVSQDISITNVSQGSGESGQTVTMSATSSDINIIPTPTVTGTGANRTLTYAPVADKYGSVTITVTADDGQFQNNTFSRTFTVTVNSVNDAPSFTKGSDQTILEDAGAQTVSGWATSISKGPPDESGQTLAFSVTNNNNALFSAQPGISVTQTDMQNSLRYTPAANAYGSATVTVVLNDQGGASSAAQTFTITVNPVNDAPVANDDSVLTNEDTAITITLLGSDIDGDTLTYSKVSDPSHGSVSITGNQAIYTPSDNYAGDDSFTFKVDDNTNSFSSSSFDSFKKLVSNSFLTNYNSSDTATISITITPINDKPVANPDSASVNEDTILTIAKSTLLANDIDVEGGSLDLTAVSNPINGSVVIDGINVKFTPTNNYFGSASFDYTVSDGSLIDTGTVAVTVNSVNDVPTANTQTVTVEEDNSIPINLVGTDIDGNVLTYAIVDNPTHGTLSAASGNQITYTPSANYKGPDSFTFKVNDGTVDSNSATVSITVSEYNDPPELDVIGNKSVDELATLTFTANAIDPDSTPSYSLTNAPTGATINSGTGNFSFTPTEAQGPGDYTFSVVVSDGTKTDSEEITVTVNEVNIAPVANNVSVSTNEDTEKVITLNATDSDSPTQTLTYSKISDPSHGSISINGNEATYTPSANYNGVDSFTYRANDETADSNTATVSITVNSVNDAPTTTDDTYLTGEDTTLTIAPSSLLDNDIDIDGNSLTAIKVTNPSNGNLILNSNGSFTYIPSANWNGTDTFTYKANDGNADGNIATVTITVNSVNDAPVCSNVDLTTDEDTQGSTEPDCTDVDEDDLIYEIVEDPSDGIASIGSLIYDPNEDFNGTDEFTYKAIDPFFAESNESIVNVIVNAVNDNPDAVGDSVRINEDSAATTINVLANDTVLPDIGETLTITDKTNGVHGTVTITNAGANLAYTPSENFNGSDSFTYTISDGNGGTDIATVSVTVNPINDAPVANNGSTSTTEDTLVAIDLVGNDIEGNSLTYSIVSGVSNGTLGIISGNHINYTPSNNYIGSDSFTFKSNDGTVDSNTATITINVTAVNDAPVAVNDSASINEDTVVIISSSTLLANDTDVDSTPIISAVGNAVNGSVSLSGTNITFTPAANFNGSASFEYTLSDGSLTDTGLVTVTVNAVNDAPVAVNNATTTAKNTLLILSSSSVLSNDSDIENNSLSITSVGNPSHGSVTFDGTNISFIPETDYIGDASFEYTISDGNGGNDIGLVTVVVLSDTQTTPDDSGDAIADSDSPEVVITDPDQPVTITVEDGTVDPTIDVSAFVSLVDGEQTGILPEITINSEVADVVIPDGTEVTGPADWDGVIQAPISGTPAGGNAPAGFSVGDTVISVGSPDGTLTFDTAVTIVLPGVTGTVGYRPSGSNVWQEITNVCTGTYENPTGAIYPGECATNNGTDTKIVTYHFTSFGSLTANQTSSSGGGTTTASAPVCNDTKPGSAPSGLTVVAGFNSVTLSWNKASDPVSYYLITYGTSSGSQTYGNPNIGGSSTTSYTITNLSGGVRYYFKVRAGNGCAPGDYSNEASTTPSGGFVEGVAPGFEAGVLGESTEQDIETTPTETTKLTSSPEVKGIDTKDWNARNIALISFGSALVVLTLLLLRRKKKTS